MRRNNKKPYKPISNPIHAIWQMCINNSPTSAVTFKMMQDRVNRWVYKVAGLCVVALLVMIGVLLNPSYEAQAVADSAKDAELGTTNSSSISLSNYNVSTTASHGITAIAGTTATINVTDAESYNLILSVEDENLVNGTTTIKPGNAVDDNTWGYYWGEEDISDDNNSSTNVTTTYESPSSNGSTLDTPALNDEGTVSFTRNLIFAAKFGNGAISGKYGTKGKLSLVSTPKAVIVFDGISTMQEMTPEICEKASAGDSAVLKDIRDDSKYSIRKMEDGKCWMNSNLKLQGNINLANPSGNALTTNDTNISANWTLPASITESSLNADLTDGCVKNFFYGTTSSANDCYYKVQSYISSTSDAGETGYYSYTAATAGWATSSVTSGTSPQSICPKGWKLPSGGRNSTTTEYYTLFNSMNLGFPSISTTGNTAWSSSSNADARLITQSSPYNFAYTGYASGGSFTSGSANGYWWSSTVDSATYAYRTGISSSNLYAGTNVSNRYLGFAVRCVAADPDLTEITTMQEMTPRVCEKTATGATNALTDTRDGSTYGVAKYPDGKCWMTQNLRIMDVDISSQDSDLADGETYYIPAYSIDDFDTSDSTEATFLGIDNNVRATGYYTWCAATAGTCSSATSDGSNAPSSICPKGWKLPTGFNSTNEFRNLFLNMGLTISNSSLANSLNGSTNWGTGDLSKAQSSPYNFNYTGYVLNDSYYAPASNQLGHWWSSTVYSAYYAYTMLVTSSCVLPGTDRTSRYYGYAVRCISQ